MAKYKKYDWPVLIAAFEKSGLTQIQFCEMNNLNPRYFSQCRKRLTQHKNSFVKVTVESPRPIGVIVEYGQCRIHCGAQATATEIAQLVRALA